jgi:hypothetical protein
MYRAIAIHCVDMVIHMATFPLVGEEPSSMPPSFVLFWSEPLYNTDDKTDDGQKVFKNTNHSSD